MFFQITKEQIEKNRKMANEDNREIVVKMENIQKTYLIGIEGVTAVRGVRCIIKRGEFVCILGTSGGGKSSLLNIMGTIDTPSRGNLKLFGKYMRMSTSDTEYAKIRLNKIGFVFQSFNLISSMTAIENVELPMLLKGDLSKGQIRRRSKALLSKVGLGERLFHYPNMLSGGEQQRVTIARALSNGPELLLLDEPTGDLDTRNTDNIMDILLELNLNEKMTLVMVTHDEYMKQYANRILHITDGKIIKQEIIDKKINQAAYKELKEKMKGYAEFDRLKKEGKSLEGKGVGVREGVADAGANMVGKTERRTVGRYPFMAFMVKKRKEEMRKNKRKNRAT